MNGVVEGGIRWMKKSNTGREAGEGNGAGAVGWDVVGDLGGGRPSHESWAPRLGGRAAGGGGRGTSENNQTQSTNQTKVHTDKSSNKNEGYLTHLSVYCQPAPPRSPPPTASCEAPKAARCASSSRGRRETWWRCDPCTAHPLRRGAHHRPSRRGARSEGGLHACPRQSA